MVASSARRGRLGIRAGGWAGRLCAAVGLAFAGIADRPAGANPPQPPADDAAADEVSPYASGAIARYTGGDGVEHARLEDEIALASGDRAPDARVPPGPFQALFDARLLVQSPGVHRLRVFAAGRVQLKLGGKLLLDAVAREPGWLDAEPIDLPFGYHALEVRYRRAEEPARLGLFWEGPGFQLEPLAARWLFHESRDTPPDDFELGHRWVRALRCSACHDLPGADKPLAAPALDRLAGNLSRAWIVDRLARRPDAAEHGGRVSQKMPDFALEPSEAEAVADYLLARSDGPQSRPAKAAGGQRAARPKTGKPGANSVPEFPNAATGGTLFRTLGCLACHRVGELGSDGLFGGGDLSQVAARRPADYFARWLADPAAINRDHRMPHFTLDALEVEHLSVYLRSLGQPPASTPAAHAADVERGAKLVRELRCGACHALPQTDAVVERVPLDVAAAARERNHCLFEADRSAGRPGYRLDATARRAVGAYLSGISGVKHPGRPDGRDLLVERNCLACHARGRARGLSDVLPAVAESDATLREVLAGLTPPSLAGVGDKLVDEALAASITASEPPRQTWLRVRMPKFPLSKQETATLTRYFVDADRMPERPGAPPVTPPASDPAIEGAGARLVTADGFGCTSCHAIGTWKPQNVALAAAGADLSQVGARVRRAWFDRFVNNPPRVVPQMEMPAIQQPIRGVLEARLDRQIAAVWQVLNREGFTPPSPSALRVVRRANLPDADERAAVLTDVIEVGEQVFVKPLVIGLPNRHNLLFDLATARLAAWWTGDVARQQTRGKTWYWEAGVPQLLPIAQSQSQGAACELTLVVDGRRHEAEARGQYLTEFDEFFHELSGVAFRHRLSVSLGGETARLKLTQRFGPWGEIPGGPTGFRRQIEIEALPGGADVEFLALPGDVTLDASGRMASSGGRGARLQVLLRSPDSARLATNDRGAIVRLAHADAKGVTIDLAYRAELAVDQFAPPPVVDRSVERIELAVVPGFEAVRLPVSDQCMPTGLGWRADGTLLVSSLEGRVWLGRDTDGDGLEDRLAPFSDELAAPFGVAATGDAIDVITKYGLVRLFDADSDGIADRTELVASGWGHTRDYHDWAVGLPRDADGNYYVSLPCQQDDRSEAAAALRGTVIRLVPREPTADDPRRFAIEPVCGGLRFGQGIARSPAGELFVTDNQGNYNPFNELNHIVEGARYGFINRLESKRGLAPPFQPAAIEIPHPWTRSVNGICFLAPPAGSPARADPNLFGPFAGHLVGCEYDTRRLVRMSLEQVDDTWQGAVYPLSREPAAGEETFEGPLACQVSPQGDLYVGNLRDSGWGGGSNTGSLVRLRWRGNLPAGIAEVRARPGGFTIEFTAAVDRARAADAGNYAVSSYRRISTPSYGGPDVDRRVETIRSVQAAPDGRRATIDLANLREGFVYEFHLRDLVGDAQFFPSEAYYTLRRQRK